MSLNDSNEQDIGAPQYGAEYKGPHRRSTDLPDREVFHEKGAVRISSIHALVVLVSFGISLVLLGTIQKKQELIEQLLGSNGGESMEQLRALMRRQEWLTGLLLLVVLLSIISVVVLVLEPMRENIAQIRAHKMLPMRGAYELRYFARAYNIMFEENQRRNEELRYKVEHDALTGLYNRGAYEKLRAAHEEENIALLWIDVDRFKGINDTYGHDIGDKVLKKVAGLLAHGFRSSDYACRTGGDEFAVIMTDITPEQKQVVTERIEAVKEGLRKRDGLPEITLSIGVAFSSQRKEGDDLYKMADKALYRVKESGRNGCAFYGPEDEK